MIKLTSQYERHLIECNSPVDTQRAKNKQILRPTSIMNFCSVTHFKLLKSQFENISQFLCPQMKMSFLQKTNSQTLKTHLSEANLFHLVHRTCLALLHQAPLTAKHRYKSKLPSVLESEVFQCSVAKFVGFEKRHGTSNKNLN